MTQRQLETDLMSLLMAARLAGVPFGEIKESIADVWMAFQMSRGEV